MNGKHYIGAKVQTVNNTRLYPAVSKVILWVDDNNYYEAGTDGGFVIEQDCPYATQAMADNLLNELGGYQYQSITAEAAQVTPTAELGDGITVNGVYTQLAYKNVRFSTGAVVDVAAPGGTEVDHEYIQKGNQTREFNRKLAETYSLIEKTAEEIRLEVGSEIDDLSASIDIQLDSITGRIDGLDGDYAEISLTLDGLTVSGPDGSTQINGGKVNTENLVVNAANITGSLTIGQLPSEIAQKDDIPTHTSDLVNDSDFQTPSGVTTIINGTVTTDYVQALGITVNAANITGTLTIGQLPSNVATDSDIPTRTSDLYNDSGYQTRNGVVSIIDGKITADYITALGLTVDSIKLGGDMTVYRTIYSSIEGGSLGYTTSSQDGSAGIHMQSGSGEVVATSNGAKLIYNSDNNQIFVASNRCGITTQGTNYYFSSSAFNADDQPTLGSSSFLWGQIYSIRATINTSDINLKRNIEVIPDKYITMLDRLDPKRFMYKNPTSDRYHLGFIAQDVKAAMDFAGISDMEFGGWCKDVDAEGNEVQMLRYSEFIAPMLAKIKQLESRIDALEASA